MHSIVNMNILVIFINFRKFCDIPFVFSKKPLSDSYKSISQAAEGSGDASSARDEGCAVALRNGHDGGCTEKTSEVNSFADDFTRSRDDAYGRCFIVDNSDCRFIGNYC